MIHLALELARERQMSGDQLSELARQMTDSANPDEVQRLREEIHRGFYGALACRDAWPPVFSPSGATENSPGQPSIARAALGYAPTISAPSLPFRMEGEGWGREALGTSDYPKATLRWLINFSAEPGLTTLTTHHFSMAIGNFCFSGFPLCLRVSVVKIPLPALPPFLRS